jgi:hypothetical protein
MTETKGTQIQSLIRLLASLEYNGLRHSAMDDLFRSLFRAAPEGSIDDLLKKVVDILGELIKMFGDKIFEFLLPSIPGFVWLIIVAILVFAWFAGRE